MLENSVPVDDLEAVREQLQHSEPVQEWAERALTDFNEEEIVLLQHLAFCIGAVDPELVPWLIQTLGFTGPAPDLLHKLSRPYLVSHSTATKWSLQELLAGVLRSRTDESSQRAVHLRLGDFYFRKWADRWIDPSSMSYEDVLSLVNACSHYQHATAAHRRRRFIIDSIAATAAKPRPAQTPDIASDERVAYKKDSFTVVGYQIGSSASCNGRACDFVRHSGTSHFHGSAVR